MINDCAEEMNEFLEKHLAHRLTLLRTLRERNKKEHDYSGQGDIYRCVKDSNLIAVRLFMDFFGLRGIFKSNNYELISNKKEHPDDRKIDKFIGRLLIPSDISEISHRTTLAGVYVRADKELAHITSVFNEEFNEEKLLIEAATIIENLLQIHLYGPLGKQLPIMDI